MDLDLFDIDRNRLDEHWLEQPKLHHKYADKLAHASKEYEQAKSERDVVAATLDRQIRTDPERYGVPKLTEASVEKAVLVNPKYRQADKAVIEAKHAMDVLRAVVSALDDRKKALENLVILWSRDYYSTPRADAGTNERMRDKKAERAFKPKGRG